MKRKKMIKKIVKKPRPKPSKPKRGNRTSKNKKVMYGKKKL